MMRHIVKPTVARMKVEQRELGEHLAEPVLLAGQLAVVTKAFIYRPLGAHC